MTKRSIKRILTIVLATSMVLGCTITAFAADTSSEGSGSYEGGEMQYPMVSVTLPTIPAGTYNYIADPNGLIALTSAAAYADSEFTGTTGVFFLTTPKTDAEGSKNQYTNKSAALEVVNQNAQDIDVTVKLEQKTAGDEGIAYSDTATFETEDTAKKLYLAVTDDAATDAQTQALSASAAAILTTTVEGNPENFEPSWDADEGYGYVVKTVEEGGDPLEWNDCSFCLTGALNKNASWEDGLTFPDIKVTWSYEEHSDVPAGPSLAQTSYTKDAANTPIVVTVNNLGEDTIASVINNGSALSSTFVTISGNTVTLTKTLLGYVTDEAAFKIVTAGGVELTFTVSP